MELMDDIQTEDLRNWYALYVKPRHEFKVELLFKSLDLEYYLPTIVQIKQWSDRRKKVTEPLFKGYIFLHAKNHERYKALAVESVINTVSFKGKPSIIPDWEMENLRRFLTNSSDVLVTDKIKIGTHVKIISGPMKDVEGVVYRSDKDDEMIAITIELLNRSVSVLLPKESVTVNIDRK